MDSRVCPFMIFRLTLGYSENSYGKPDTQYIEQCHCIEKDCMMWREYKGQNPQWDCALARK